VRKGNGNGVSNYVEKQQENELLCYQFFLVFDFDLHEMGS
jgi:hypothetical protein